MFQKTKVFSVRDIVKATIAEDSTVPTIRLFPCFNKPSSDDQDSPCLNLLNEESRTDENDNLPNEVMEKIKPGQSIPTDGESNTKIVYYHDGDTIYILRFFKTAEVKIFFESFLDGGFETTLHNSTVDKSWSYSIQPDTKNLLNYGKRLLENFSKN